MSDTQFKNRTFRQFRVTLQNQSLGEKEFYHLPDGWKNAGYSLSRSQSYQGIFRKYAINKLGFVKAGREYLLDAVNRLGFDAEVTVKIYEYDFSSYSYKLQFEGKIELISKENTDIKFNVNVSDSSFESKVLNRDDIETILSSLTTIDGFQLSGFTSEKQFITLPQRQDSLFSELANSQIQPTDPFEFANYIKDRYPEDGLAFPLRIVSGEDEKIKSCDTNYQQISGAFYVNNSLVETSLDIELDLSFEAADWNAISGYEENPNFGEIKAAVSIFDQNDNLVSHSDIDLSTSFLRFDPWEFGLVLGLMEYSGTANKKITVQPNNYVQLTMRPVTATTYGRVYVNTAKTNLKVFSKTTDTQEKRLEAFMMHEAFSRVAQNISGRQTAFKSDLIGRTDSEPLAYEFDGDFSKIALTNGGLIRGFETNEFPLSASLKKLFDCINSMTPIGLGVEDLSGEKVLRLERLHYFFDTRIAATIENASNVTDEYNKDLIYNKVKIGFKKGQADEIREGIFDYNTQAEWVNQVKSVKNELSIVSDYSASNAQINAARKITKEEQPTKDSKYDDTNFIIDLVRSEGGNSVLNEKFSDGLTNWTIRNDVFVTSLRGDDRAALKWDKNIEDQALLLQYIKGDLEAPTVSFSYKVLGIDEEGTQYTPSFQLTAFASSGQAYSLNSAGEWVEGELSAFLPVTTSVFSANFSQMETFQITAIEGLDETIDNIFIGFTTDFIAQKGKTAVFLVDDVFVGDSSKFKAREGEGFSKIENIVNNQQSYNIRFSPANSLRRWGSVLRAFLENAITSSYVFSKSGKDSAMVSQIEDGPEVDEKGDVLVNDLDVPLWKPERISFEAPLTQAIRNNINGTFADGKPRYYALVKWRENESQAYRYGWIEDFNDKGIENKGEFEIRPASIYVEPREEAFAVDDDYAIFEDDDNAKFTIT